MLAGIKSKLVCMLLAIALIIAIFTLPIFADTAVDKKWEDVALEAAVNADYRMVDETNITIYTAKGLAWLSYYVNHSYGDSDSDPDDIIPDGLRGVTITLNNDIDLRTAGVYSRLSDVENDPTKSWIPIGGNDIQRITSFRGVFNGNNKVISGVYIVSGDNSDFHDNQRASAQGLFSYVNDVGTVKNLGLSDSSITATTAASIVASNGGSVLNCYSSATVSAFSDSLSDTAAGGIVATNTGTIDGCYFTGSVSSIGNYESGNAGGIVSGTSGAVTNCYNAGTVNSNDYSAGIAAGCSGPTAFIKNCYNSGDIYSENRAFGILGTDGHFGATVFNCYSSGNSYAKGLSDTSMGEFIGYGNSASHHENNRFLTNTANAQSYLGDSIESTDRAVIQNAMNNWVEQPENIDGGYKYWLIDEDLNPSFTKTNPTPLKTWDTFAMSATEGTDYETDSLGNVTINTAAGLAWLSLQVNSGTDNFEGKTITLGDNINLATADVHGYGGSGNTADATVTTENSWPSIGIYGYEFKGNFDGNDKTVSGLYINYNLQIMPYNTFQGLFGIVSDATITDLGVINSYIKGIDRVGGIMSDTSIWSSNVVLTNCYNTADITAVDYYAYIGGVAGNINGDIIGCYNEGTITATQKNSYVGGVAGWVGAGEIVSSYNLGAIIGHGDTSGVGGLAGRSSSSKVLKSYNVGTVTANGESNRVGGLVGDNSGWLENSYNEGSVTVNGNGAFIGGIAGASKSVSLKNNYNKGTVYANGTGAEIGGIIGGDDYYIYNCYNLARVYTSNDSANTVGAVSGTGRAYDSYFKPLENSATIGIGGTPSDTRVKTAENIITLQPLLNSWVEEENEDGGDFWFWSLDEDLNPSFVNTMPQLTLWADVAASAAEGEDYVINDTVYEIKTAAGLAWFAQQVDVSANSFEGKTVKLANNIDLTTAGVVDYNHRDADNDGIPDSILTTNSWLIIGDKNDFKGTFDGSNKTISGVLFVNPKVYDAGLFGDVSGATIKDLTIDRSYISCYSGGVLVNEIYNSRVENVKIMSDATITSDSSYAAIAGITANATYNSAIISCENNANITATGNNSTAAGIVAKNGNASRVENCSNTAVITANTAGGIVAEHNDSQVVVENCFNTGNIAAVSENARVGGIVGEGVNENARVHNSYNFGEITPVDATTTVGAVAGFYMGITENCYFKEGTADLGVGYNASASGVLSTNTLDYQELQTELNEWVTTNTTEDKSYYFWKIDSEFRPTLSMTDGTVYTITGHVSATNSSSKTVVTLKKADGAVVDTIEAVKETLDGEIIERFIFTEVAKGSYELTISKDGYLPLKIVGITVSNADVNLQQEPALDSSAINMVTGDVNGDNIINEEDLNKITDPAIYNKPVTGTGDGASADLNGDNRIDFNDLAIARNGNNYNKSIENNVIDISQ